MHGRHFPRLCRSCDAPMARQQDACWSCGAAWDDRPANQRVRPVTRSGEPAWWGSKDQPPALMLVGKAPALVQPSVDVDRLAHEGGHLADEKPRRINAPTAAVR